MPLDKSKFFINLIRNLSIVHLVLSLNVTAYVFDHPSPPPGYQLFVLVNVVISLLAWLWLVANCSEMECQKFLLEQKQLGVQIGIILVAIVRIGTGSVLLEMYIVEEDESYQFTNKTMFLIASVLAYVSAVFTIYIIIFGKTIKDVNKLANDNPNSGFMLKPYNRNHIAKLKKISPPYYIKTPRIGRFKS
jgi:hypothetical protein